MDEWIEEQEKILNININYKREPVEYIHFHFCYVDADDSIVSLKTEKHTFSSLVEGSLSEAPPSEAPRLLSEAQLLKIIDDKKQHENINYTFSELSLFHVDLEPENIQTIEPTLKPFFKTFPFISDIPIQPSIFVFHPLNSLFFLFKRRKSILKKRNDNERNNQKSTKKVAFSLPPSKKHTRRII